MSTGVIDHQPPEVSANRSAWSTPISLLSRGLDHVCDLAVLAFASWTVLYHVGLIFKLPTNPLLVVWVLTIPVLLWALVRSSKVTGATGTIERLGAVARAPMAAAVAVAALSTYFVMSGVSALWRPGWALGVGATVVALVLVVRAPGAPPAAGSRAAEPPREQATDPVPLVGTVLALLSSFGLGIFSVFTHLPNADDAFYVNRATWVADHGLIPDRDTMFTNQRLPAIRGAGVPVSSIETFQGAVAHAFHLAGGTAAFLLTPPVGTALAVWALWRLIRSWAPRRLALCFAVAIVYLLWGTDTFATLGSFFLTRMQQGKVVFVAMMVPLLYVYLTKWLRSPDRRTAGLLFAAGVAAVGFTSSSTFLVPIICASVALPLLLRRNYRCAAGAMIPFIYPLVVGVVVHFQYASVDPNGRTWIGRDAMHFVIGDKWFGALGWFAALTAVWLVRAGAARLATAGISAMLLIVLGPAVLGLMNDVTGAHAVLWRVVWVAPLPALVGLLAAVPLPASYRWLAPVPAAGCIALIVGSGLLAWAPQVRATEAVVMSRPAWRVQVMALRQARRIMALKPGPGPVLAPYRTMQALDILTTKVHPVSPLTSYIALLVEPKPQHDARELLNALMVTYPHVPPVATIKSALATLQVSMACLPKQWVNRRRVFVRIGYATEHAAGSQVCLTKS